MYVGGEMYVNIVYVCRFCSCMETYVDVVVVCMC
jgi:hypothetical protein